MESIELGQYKSYESKENSTDTVEYFGYFASKERIYDLICATPLVTPKMKQTWKVYKNDGTTLVSTSTNSSLTVETGFKVNLILNWLIPESDNSLPEKAGLYNGNVLLQNYTNLPKQNEEVEYSENNISSNKSFTLKLFGQNTAPKVSGEYLVKPSGEGSNEITSSVSCNVVFAHRTFCGKKTNTPTDTTGLTDNGLKTLKALTVSGVTTNSSEYYCYMYPKALGALTKIIQDGALPIFNAFNKTEINVINEAGVSIPYYVYTSANRGAFNNAIIAFS